MQILARSAAGLAVPGTAPGEVEELLEGIPAEAGLDCELALVDGALEVRWHATPSPVQEAFVAVLAECVTLAGTASDRARYALLDSEGFAAEAGRMAVAARWRSQDASLAVFEVDGILLGPGVDESEMIAHVGALARSVVRADDSVGHLGAGRFGLLLPGAGSFEARSAYRRVREAVGESPYAADGVHCAAAGFAELSDGDMLAAATQRLVESQRRSAYSGPCDPMHPLAG
jgi:hypothetical protein